MDTRTPYLSIPSGSLDDRPPVLVVSGDPAASRMQGLLGDAGWRAMTVARSALRDRLAMQARATCLLVETDGLGDNWEAQLCGEVDPAMPMILSGSVPTIDRMAAFADRRNAEILVEPTVMDLALAVETVRSAAAGSRVNDVSAEPSAARLRQLSDEVGRIAATLARLSTAPKASSVELPATATDSSDGPISGDMVRAVIRARRMRARFFDAELFADPAWDMLLDLFQAEIAQHRVPVSSLCIAAAVPPTTALRWIKTMTDAGLFRRRADPHDGRRVFVELAPDASRAMRGYFAQAGTLAAA